MSQILSGQDGVQCYLDDIIVYGENPEVHEKRLQAILKHLQSSGLKLNEENCHFRKTELPFLVISASGLHPDPDHVLAIQQSPAPHDRVLEFFSGSWRLVFQIHSQFCDIGGSSLCTALTVYWLLLDRGGSGTFQLCEKSDHC